MRLKSMKDNPLKQKYTDEKNTIEQQKSKVSGL